MSKGEAYRRIECELCGPSRNFLRITNTHLWKAHRITMAEYRERFPEAEIEDPQLAADRVSHLRGQKYEQIYGEEKGKELRAVRSDDATKQFEDPDQRLLRESTSSRPMSEESRRKLSESRTSHGGANYRQRALDHCGEQCQLCGAEPESISDLFVHHKDMNHADAAGNHSLENLEVVCRRCHSKLHRQSDGKFRGLSRFEKGIIYVLEGMRRDFGIDVMDENFKDTPKRFARAMSEMLFGAYDTKRQIEEILASSFDAEGFDQFLVVKNVPVASLCPHHLLPVRYAITIGYLPGDGGRVLGLSKLPRLAEVIAARPVLQEVVTREIATFLMEEAKAAGAAVVVRGEHSCMWARGVKKDCNVLTSVMLGTFRENASARMEILNMMKDL